MVAKWSPFVCYKNEKYFRLITIVVRAFWAREDNWSCKLYVRSLVACQLKIMQRRRVAARGVIFTLILICFITPQVQSNEENTEATHSGNETHHDEHEEHHGIHLVSWRWSEFSNYFVCCVMIIMAASVKVIFHEVPILYKHMPESCVLIILGQILGCVVYFGVSSHSHHFPE